MRKTTIMAEVYQAPNYYDIAFSFRDISAEIKVFEDVIQRYSRIPVERVLEIACGHAPHLTELHRRGYSYVGLDSGQAMLNEARKNAQAVGANAAFVLADMTQFHIEEPVDFAFILLGSLYVSDTAALVSHFDAVSRALKPGGLYFLDWCIEFSPTGERQESWDMEQDGICVTTTFQTRLINVVEQTCQEVLTLDVDDRGSRKAFREVIQCRTIYPQEFLLFVRQRSEFEFVGWWNNWDLTRPLDGKEDVNRPIAIIRKV